MDYRSGCYSALWQHCHGQCYSYLNPTVYDNVLNHASEPEWLQQFMQSCALLHHGYAHRLNEHCNLQEYNIILIYHTYKYIHCSMCSFHVTTILNILHWNLVERFAMLSLLPQQLWLLSPIGQYCSRSIWIDHRWISATILVALTHIIYLARDIDEQITTNTRGFTQVHSVLLK